MMMYVTLLSCFGNWFPCTQPPEPCEMYAMGGPCSVHGRDEEGMVFI